MTLTLTTQELNTYANKIGAWYDERAKAVLNAIEGGLDKEAVDKLKNVRLEYEKINPKPTWKELL